MPAWIAAAPALSGGLVRSISSTSATNSGLTGTNRIAALRSGVHHEFEQVPIRVTHIDARSRLTAPAFPGNRTELYFCRGVIEQILQGLGRAFPNEAKIPARRYRGGSPRREALVLPAGRTVKVDHVVAEIDRAGSGGFPDVA